jgi:hypothetical protein
MATNRFVETRFSMAARQVCGIAELSPIRSEFRLQVARNRVNAELQTLHLGHRRITHWKAGQGKRRGVTRLIRAGLDHVDDPGQFHLTERTPPLALSVPKGQAPEFFALNHHYLVRCRRKVVDVFQNGARKQIGHVPEHPPAAARRLAGFCQRFNDAWPG